MNTNLEQITRKVNRLVVERDKLKDDAVRIEQRLLNKEQELRSALEEQKNVAAALSIAPPTIKHRSRKASEEYRVRRVRVLSHLKDLGNVWVSPSNLAMLVEMTGTEVAEVLRDVAKDQDIPVEHNGKMGKHSKYRWTSGANKE